jgi:hypothetical protein
VQLENFLGVAVGLLADGGKPNPVVQAIEQANIQCLFELGYLKADRRLGHIEDITGFDKAQLAARAL